MECKRIICVLVHTVANKRIGPFVRIEVYSTHSLEVQDPQKYPMMAGNGEDSKPVCRHLCVYGSLPLLINS